MHLAQLNIARALYDIDDSKMAAFTDNIDTVNYVAERSKGFVWRYTEEDDSLVKSPWSDDPRMLVNMSIWESPEDLEHFVWNTVHKKIYDKKEDWFPQMEMAHFVMWWVPIGHTPTLEEARQKLEYLDKHGSTDDAFSWDKLTNLKTWMHKQCG